MVTGGILTHKMAEPELRAGAPSQTRGNLCCPAAVGPAKSAGELPPTGAEGRRPKGAARTQRPAGLV